MTEMNLDAARETRRRLLYVSDGSPGADRLAQVIRNHDLLLAEVQRARSDRDRWAGAARLSADLLDRLRARLARVETARR